MRTCEQHDDLVVVYEYSGYGRAECPLCQVIEKLENSEKANEEYQEQIDGLKDELDEALAKVENL